MCSDIVVTDGGSQSPRDSTEGGTLEAGHTAADLPSFSGPRIQEPPIFSPEFLTPGSTTQIAVTAVVSRWNGHFTAALATLDHNRSDTQVRDSLVEILERALTDLAPANSRRSYSAVYEAFAGMPEFSQLKGATNIPADTLPTLRKVEPIERCLLVLQLIASLRSTLQEAEAEQVDLALCSYHDRCAQGLPVIFKSAAILGEDGITFSLASAALIHLISICAPLSGDITGLEHGMQRASRSVAPFLTAVRGCAHFASQTSSSLLNDGQPTQSNSNRQKLAELLGNSARVRIPTISQNSDASVLGALLYSLSLFGNEGIPIFHSVLKQSAQFRAVQHPIAPLQVLRYFEGMDPAIVRTSALANSTSQTASPALVSALLELTVHPAPSVQAYALGVLVWFFWDSPQTQAKLRRLESSGEGSVPAPVWLVRDAALQKFHDQHPITPNATARVSAFIGLIRPIPPPRIVRGITS